MTDMTHHSLISQHIAPMDWHKKVFHIIKLWNRNAATRKQLKDLPDYLLEDIGIDRATAMSEANRSITSSNVFLN